MQYFTIYGAHYRIRERERDRKRERRLQQGFKATFSDSTESISNILVMWAFVEEDAKGKKKCYPFRGPSFA